MPPSEKNKRPDLSEPLHSVDGEGGDLSALLQRVARAPNMLKARPVLGHSGILPQIGPYQPLSPLGRGGMGVVFLAEHGETGAQVALKTLTEARATSMRGLRNEIKALRRLWHPSVVRILDEGVEQGLPWYSMELIEGCPLSAMLGRKISSAVHMATLSKKSTVAQPWTWSLSGPRHRDAAPSGEARVEVMVGEPTVFDAGMVERLGLVAQLAHALAYLHGEGVVHCDLKPDNILVTPEGRAVLVDFGLSQWQGARVSSEEVVEAGIAAGTIRYMSPERIRGDDFDARLDLYALGCVLYELVTGNPVFASQSTAEIRHAHLNLEPISPSLLVKDLPRSLNALIIALLAKDPRHRPGHAQAIIRVLKGVGVSVDTASYPEVRPLFYPPTFAGRAEAVEHLEAVLSSASEGEGRGVLLVGESGVGKSRLSLEVARVARRKATEVFSGRGDGALGAFEGVLRGLSDKAFAAGAASVASWFGPHLKVLSPYAPFLEGLPGAQSLPEPVSLPPKEARQRVFSALRSVLDSALGRSPTLLVLDDLQWADELSRQALVSLMRGVHKRPWVIVGVCRAEEGGEVREALEALASVEILPLGRLDEAAGAEIACGMLGTRTAPASLVGFVSRHAGGNPLFVIECVREAVSTGFLSLDRSGAWRFEAHLDDHMAALPMPETLQGLLEARLGSLSGEMMRVCEAVVVLGPDATPSRAARLVGVEVEEALDTIEALIGHGVLRWGSKSWRSGQVGFVHHTLAELARGRLAAERLGRLHKLAAEVLSEVEGADLGRRAWHWHHAGDRARALEAHEIAAKALGRACAFRDSAEHYEAMLGLLTEGSAQHIEVSLALSSNCLEASGRFDEAVARLRAVLEELGHEGSPIRAEVALRLGTALRQIGELEEAESLLLEALEAARQMGDPGIEGRSLSEHAVVLRQKGDLERSARQSEAALERLGASEGETPTGRVLEQLGMTLLSLGRTEEAFELQEEALERHRAEGSATGEGRVLNNLSWVLNLKGHIEEAISMGQVALAHHQAVGFRGGEGDVLNTTGNILLAKGRTREALDRYKEALEIHREVGRRGAEAMALNGMGAALQQQGRFGEALVCYKEALALNRILGQRLYELTSLENIGLVVARMGDREAALVQYNAAIEISREIHNRARLSSLLNNKGFTLQDLGRFEDAREVFEEALEVQIEIGDKRRAAMTRGSVAVGLRYQGQSLEALEILEVVKRSFEQIGARGFLAFCLCDMGFNLLALGRGADEKLAQARAIAEAEGFDEGGYVMAAIDGLTRAIVASNRGEPLLAGQCPEDLSESVRLRLEGER